MFNQDVIDEINDQIEDALRELKHARFTHDRQKALAKIETLEGLLKKNSPAPPTADEIADALIRKLTPDNRSTFEKLVDCWIENAR